MGGYSKGPLVDLMKGRTLESFGVLEERTSFRFQGMKGLLFVLRREAFQKGGF